MLKKKKKKKEIFFFFFKKKKKKKKNFLFFFKPFLTTPKIRHSKNAHALQNNGLFHKQIIFRLKHHPNQTRILIIDQHDAQ